MMNEQNARAIRYGINAAKNGFWAEPPEIARIDDAHTKLAYETYLRIKARNEADDEKAPTLGEGGGLY